MSRTYYHRHERKMHHPPRWFTNLVVVRPERRDNHRKIRNILKGGLEHVEDAPEFGKGNKPNADWSWF